MFIDSTTIFEQKGTSLATVVSNGTSSYVVDLGGPAIGGSQGRDLGVGPDSNGPFLTLTINNLATTGTNVTLQFALQGAPDNGSGAPGTYRTMLMSPVYTAAQLEQVGLADYVFPIVLPPVAPGQAPPRFLQLTYTLGGTSPVITAGTIFAGLTIGRDDQVFYQSGFTPPPASGAGA